MRLILTSHSEILIPPECGFMIWLQEKYKGWCLADVKKPGKIEEFVNDLFECKKFETWKLEKSIITET